MKKPKYLDEMNMEGPPRGKIFAARRQYRKRLVEMGITPDTEMWQYFVKEVFAANPVQLLFSVDLRGACALKFVFSTKANGNGRVRVCFQDVQDLQCKLYEGSRYYRDYLHTSIWKTGNRYCICIMLTSHRNEDSSIMFSFKTVSFTHLKK